MHMNKNNPLKNYFLHAKDEHSLKTYNDIADFFGISRGIVSNVIYDQTLYPSRQLVEKISKKLTTKPEIILADIYQHCFSTYHYRHELIVAMSLFYYFKYSMYFTIDNHFQPTVIKLPFVINKVLITITMRRNGPELKYTGIVSWQHICDILCSAYNSSYLYVHDPENPFAPYSDKETFLFAMTSGMYAILHSKDMSDYKKIIVVFDSNCPSDVEYYNQFRNFDEIDSSRILPLLYDENAEYSIRDVDQI